MESFDATHAWDMGYHCAVRGIIRAVPPGTWMANYSKDFYAGYDAAILDGAWGENQECRY